MKTAQNRPKRNAFRMVTFLAAIALCAGALLMGSNKANAGHPVLVEGNCDSPVPGTTLVSPGTCGDFDGDGRIGTAEDTDGADRIFGTINAALGNGTGAAAGTGINANGTVLIVASGRFAETVYIGQGGFGFPGGSQAPSNVTLEAAPGVEAAIDAQYQGDPAGGNAARGAGPGIMIIYPASVPAAVVTLRNLAVRNFSEGIAGALSSRVVVDHCRLDNNLNYGIHAIDSSLFVITNTQVVASGRRNSVGLSNTSLGGDGIRVQDTAKARISDTTVSHCAGNGIIALGGGTATLYKVGTFFNGTDTSGAITIAPNPNAAN